METVQTNSNEENYPEGVGVDEVPDFQNLGRYHALASRDVQDFG